jgi:hypothetical protein
LSHHKLLDIDGYNIEKKKPARPRWKIINEAAFGLLGCWLAVIDARREAAFVCIRFSVPRLVSAAEPLQRHAAMVQRRHHENCSDGVAVCPLSCGGSMHARAATAMDIFGSAALTVLPSVPPSGGAARILEQQ